MHALTHQPTHLKQGGNLFFLMNTAKKRGFKPKLLTSRVERSLIPKKDSDYLPHPGDQLSPLAARRIWLRRPSFAEDTEGCCV